MSVHLSGEKTGSHQTALGRFVQGAQAFGQVSRRACVSCACHRYERGARPCAVHVRVVALCVRARTSVRACVCPDEIRRAQFGEIRLQFHVVTDGHDQMRAPIKAFLATMNTYGQPDVDLLTTDNPYFDKSFFHEVIPSLKNAELRFNTDLPCQARGPAVSVLHATRYQTLNQTQAINAKITAVRAQMAVQPPCCAWYEETRLCSHSG